MVERREAEGVPWKALADLLGVYPGPLSSLPRLKYGTSMTMAMKLTQWLGHSAASFTYAAEW
jgi:plasmid maintenance system antidote protein VapI